MKNTAYQNLWDLEKAVFVRGMFIALNAQTRKKGRSKINHLSFRLGKQEKDQFKPNASRIKKIIIKIELKSMKLKTEHQ